VQHGPVAQPQATFPSDLGLYTALVPSNGFTCRSRAQREDRGEGWRPLCRPRSLCYRYLDCTTDNPQLVQFSFCELRQVSPRQTLIWIYLCAHNHTYIRALPLGSRSSYVVLLGSWFGSCQECREGIATRAVIYLGLGSEQFPKKRLRSPLHVCLAESESQESWRVQQADVLGSMPVAWQVQLGA
jgi:hypothetical protein